MVDEQPSSVTVLESAPKMLQCSQMVPRKSSQKAAASQPQQYRTHPPRPPAGPPEIVDPVWLVKALAMLIVAALLCGYGTLCFLLYQGQWQLILHPRRTTVHPAEIAGTPLEFVRFGPDESAQPQRTGWLIPASPGARYAGTTILFLPSGDGSLADSVPTLEALHNLGVSLFAIDYRGYGESVPVHPNEQRMTEDVDSSWQFLTTIRNVPETQIVPYGTGLGASLAVHLAAEHPAVRALILDTPGPDPLLTVEQDPRTKMLPVKLLLKNRFPLRDALSALTTPKLLLSPYAADPAFAAAAAPKLSVELRAPRSQTLYRQSLSRFLDQYVVSRP